MVIRSEYRIESTQTGRARSVFYVATVWTVFAFLFFGVEVLRATAQSSDDAAPSVSSSGPFITVPAPNASVLSPVLLSGNKGSLLNVDHMRILLDGGTDIFDAGYLPFANKWMFLPEGQHTVTLAAYNKSNAKLGANTISVNVRSEVLPAVLPQLQRIPAWQWCTATLNGLPCASGLGNATSSVALKQSAPSLSGSSSVFSIGGKTGYSNALWWISLGGGTLLSHFTYDLEFYVDNASAPEALEFDVNQSFGGVRYTWGTECSYKDTGRWDVWNPLTKRWFTTTAPCPQVTSKQWHHLTWQFERVNNQVHYISVTLDGRTYPINLYMYAQNKWNLDDIDIAFQMDGDYKQTPYRVWLDNVHLVAY